MFSKLLTWATLCCSSLLISVSAETKIQFVDQHNKPIQNLVVSIQNHTQTLVSDIGHIAVMDQVNYQFDPKVLVIEKNQWVDFPNSDDVRHHVYSFSSPKAFEIKMFSGTDAAPIKFEEPGIVVLGCNIHDSMVGYIYIRDNEHTFMTSKEGVVVIEDTLQDINSIEETKLTIWHWALSANSAQRQLIQLKDYKNANKDDAIEYVVNLDIQVPNTSELNKTTGFKSKFRRN